MTFSFLAQDDYKQPLVQYASSLLPAHHRADMLATWYAESGFTPSSISGINSNGTRDYGICQLNSRYHTPFIESPDFQDPYKQIDYCVSVYYDAVKKGRSLGSVWYGWANRQKFKNQLIQIDSHQSST